MELTVGKGKTRTGEWVRKKKTSQLTSLSNQEPFFIKMTIKSGQATYSTWKQPISRAERKNSGFQRNSRAKHASWGFTRPSCVEVIHLCLRRPDAWIKVITDMQCTQEAWAKWEADMRITIQLASSLYRGSGPQKPKRKVSGFKWDRDAWEVAGGWEQGAFGDKNMKQYDSVEMSLQNKGLL